MVEDYEDDIENWYYNEQGADLMQYLCADRILKKHDQSQCCFKDKGFRLKWYNVFIVTIVLLKFPVFVWELLKKAYNLK